MDNQFELMNGEAMTNDLLGALYDDVLLDVAEIDKTEFGGTSQLQQELLGSVRAQQPAEKLRTKAVLTGALTFAADSRREMLSRMNRLPKAVRRGILAGKLQIADKVFYSSKPVISGNLIEIFTANDNKTTGVSNVSNAKIDAGYFFLCTGFQVLFSIMNPNPFPNDMQTQQFLPFHGNDPLFLNAEFSFKIGLVFLMNEISLSQVFTVGTEKNEQLAYFYKLDNPKLITPQEEIKFDIRLPQMPGAWVNPTAPNNVKAVKVLLYGSVVQSA
jgi:hypothetical protein